MTGRPDVVGTTCSPAQRQMPRLRPTPRARAQTELTLPMPPDDRGGAGGGEGSEGGEEGVDGGGAGAGAGDDGATFLLSEEKGRAGPTLSCAWRTRRGAGPLHGASPPAALL